MAAQKELKSKISPKEAATTSKTTSAAAADKVEPFHHRLQASNVAVYVYAALQLLTFLPVKF